MERLIKVLRLYKSGDIDEEQVISKIIEIYGENNFKIV